MKRPVAILVLMAAAVAGLPACSSSDDPTEIALADQGTSAATSAPAAGNAVTDWGSIVAPAVHSAAAPRRPASSFVLHAVSHLAVYDAVVAIEGGYTPYAEAIGAPEGANLDAAVATAAYRAALGRVAPTQRAYLDGKYTDYLAGIADGTAKTDGVEVGEKAAAAVLAKRGDDSFATAVSYRCSADPLPLGEFEPNEGCGTEPIDASVAQVKPFTFDDPARFRPDGPDTFTSDRWATDFEEVKAFGGKDSTARTVEQTDIAYFWSEHAYVHWNRNLIALVGARALDVPDTARLFAMAYTAAADAAIAGFEAKYSYRTWRPRTAILRAADDGNPTTSPDPNWAPLLSVDHPEYPSGHSFVSTALTDAVAAFIGTRELTWTLVTSKDAVPQLVAPERTYSSLDALMAEVTDARVWSGLHYRNSMREGAELGHEVAQHVTNDYFRPVS